MVQGYSIFKCCAKMLNRWKKFQGGRFGGSFTPLEYAIVAFCRSVALLIFEVRAKPDKTNSVGLLL